MPNESQNQITEKTPVRVGSYLEVEPGVDIYYEDEGEGRPIVLVPGWTFTTRVFDNQFSAFSGTHRVISFDPRSHGRSSVTLSGNNHATHARDLRKLMDHLGLEKPAIVGWSTGAFTAWHYVRDNGTDDIAGLVNIDMPPIGTSTSEGDWIEGAFEELVGFFQGVQNAAGLRGLIEWYAANVMIEKDMSPELTQWVVGQTMAVPPLIAANLIADATFANYVEEIVAVDASIPSLHVAAAHWAETAEQFIRSKCPKSRFESFGGHMMFWEYPDRFNPILSEFLATTQSVRNV